MVILPEILMIVSSKGKSSFPLVLDYQLNVGYVPTFMGLLADMYGAPIFTIKKYSKDKFREE